MAGFLKKLFGGKGKTDDLEGLVKDTLEGIIEKSGLDLVYDVNLSQDGEASVMTVDLSGGDEELVKDKKGQVLDAFQLLLKRVVQHNFPEDKTNIAVDCGGYREESEAALIERAENLKTIAIEQGRSVYYRALPPKDRKVVHQYLAKDPRVKSRSLGDGLYKKIKIYPVKNADANATAGGDEATQD
jgi:spoIIIJ-associated protein